MAKIIDLRSGQLLPPEEIARREVDLVEGRWQQWFLEYNKNIFAPLTRLRYDLEQPDSPVDMEWVDKEIERLMRARNSAMSELQQLLSSLDHITSSSAQELQDKISRGLFHLNGLRLETVLSTEEIVDEITAFVDRHIKQIMPLVYGGDS